ncbi:MAG: hypothetical protein ACYC0V_18100 [Armatimonadota bacterium]
MNNIYQAVYDRVSALPAIDVHTHLVGGKAGARGLHDIAIYHMAISDLYSAGSPSGARLTQYPGWPDEAEAERRIIEALPYFENVRNTSTSYGVRLILEDLYGWNEPITESNWRVIDALIKERSDDKAWQRQVMRKAGIKRFGTEIARREDGSDDDIFQYALEWAFFTRCQWGEYDTALYELERCWGKTPGSPAPIGSGGRPKTDRMIRTLDDAHEAIKHYVANIPHEQVIAMATHISTDIDFHNVSDAEMTEALKKRDSAGPEERDIYASYINEAFLTALEPYGDSLVFQFSFGAEPLPYETASRLSQKTIAQLAEMVSKHPQIRFQCFLSNMHANQSICTLCRELPNLSVAGYWWHNFFPSYIRRVMDERLDMLPLNKQVGFFSDAYCIEWAYAKSVIIRQELSRVLADKVKYGQYTEDMAVGIALDILYKTPQTLLGMVPVE